MDYFNLIDINQYHNILNKQLGNIALEKESVQIDEAYGRYCAEEIRSPENLPGFRRSQVDGYAVISQDTFSASSAPVYLKCLGTLAVDEDAGSRSIHSGECYRISTGGMLPNNADSVVMIEHTNLIDEDTVEIIKPVSPMENVIREDEDLKAGDIIISTGNRITTYHIGVLSSLGVSMVPVFKKIGISVISTGNEIVDIKEKSSPGKIRDVNSHTLLSLCRRYGANPKTLGIARDNVEEIYGKVESAIEESDIILISGGSSVGTRDLTIEVINKFKNSKILFHGIAIKPGKPTIMALVGEKIIFGLPGQVTSSIVSFFLTVLPVIKKIYKNDSTLPFIKVVAGTNIKSTLGREEWIKCRLETIEVNSRGKNSIENKVYPVYSKSGVLGPFIKSDGFLVIPSDREGIRTGEAGYFLPYELIL